MDFAESFPDEYDILNGWDWNTDCFNLYSVDGESTDNVNQNNIYFIADTHLGRNIFGHWMWEVALFLPFYKYYKVAFPNLKLLLYSSRNFKKNTLKDFNIGEDDIIYSKCFPYNEEQGHVFPDEPFNSYKMIVPKFTFLPSTGIEHPFFLKLLKIFRFHYKIPENPEKKINITYFIRSRKENWCSDFNNLDNLEAYRKFINFDKFLELIKKYNIYICDIDNLSSIKEQVEIVYSSKNIIIEFGSAHTINGCFFAKNSNFLILNDIGLGSVHTELLNKCYENNNLTTEIFQSTDDWTRINIDLVAFENRLKEIMD